MVRLPVTQIGLQCSAHGTHGRTHRRRYLPTLEWLEGRTAPAIFTVNTTADTVAVNLVTGQDASNKISLRSAMMAANNTGEGDTINLPAGNYLLTRPFTSDADA